jgi:hypothetical protein
MRVCKKCEINKPISEYFYNLTKTKKYYRLSCKDCERARTRAWHHNLKESQKEARRSMRLKNYHKNPLLYKTYASNFRIKIKKEVLSYYGGGEAKCIICGFDNIDALCIDHINNNGAEERKNIYGNNSRAGATFYNKLKVKKFPPGYQTLCANHNMIKELKRKRKERGY